jgi:hypothetical protein
MVINLCHVLKILNGFKRAEVATEDMNIVDNQNLLLPLKIW